jgi:hypothetical protein
MGRSTGGQEQVPMFIFSSMAFETLAKIKYY